MIAILELLADFNELDKVVAKLNNILQLPEENKLGTDEIFDSTKSATTNVLKNPNRLTMGKSLAAEKKLNELKDMITFEVDKENYQIIIIITALNKDAVLAYQDTPSVQPAVLPSGVQAPKQEALVAIDALLISSDHTGLNSVKKKLAELIPDTEWKSEHTTFDQEADAQKNSAFYSFNDIRSVVPIDTAEKILKKCDAIDKIAGRDVLYWIHRVTKGQFSIKFTMVAPEALQRIQATELNNILDTIPSRLGELQAKLQEFERGEQRLVNQLLVESSYSKYTTRPQLSVPKQKSFPAEPSASPSDTLPLDPQDQISVSQPLAPLASTQYTLFNSKDSRSVFQPLILAQQTSSQVIAPGNLKEKLRSKETPTEIQEMPEQIIQINVLLAVSKQLRSVKESYDRDILKNKNEEKRLIQNSEREAKQIQERLQETTYQSGNNLTLNKVFNNITVGITKASLLADEHLSTLDSLSSNRKELENLKKKRKYIKEPLLGIDAEIKEFYSQASVASTPIDDRRYIFPSTVTADECLEGLNYPSIFCYLDVSEENLVIVEIQDHEDNISHKLYCMQIDDKFVWQYRDPAMVKPAKQFDDLTNAYAFFLSEVLPSYKEYYTPGIALPSPEMRQALQEELQNKSALQLPAFVPKLS